MVSNLLKIGARRAVAFALCLLFARGISTGSTRLVGLVNSFVDTWSARAILLVAHFEQVETTWASIRVARFASRWRVADADVAGSLELLLLVGVRSAHFVVL
eukprot:g44047.t1